MHGERRKWGPVPLGPTAAHEHTPIARGAWARWRSLRSIMNKKVIEARARDKRRQQEDLAP